jgi:hypothetical protein
MAEQQNSIQDIINRMDPQLKAIFNALQQSHEQELQALRLEVKDQLSLVQQQRQPNTTTATSTSQDLLTSTLKVKQKLPKLAEYNGKRDEWNAWHQQAKLKLATDGGAIGSELDQFAYIYACLRGSAAQATLTYVETQPEGEKTGEKLLKYMNTFYGDPTKQQRAVTSLFNIKQGQKEPFYAFLPKFETVLANGGGMSWPNEAKIAALQNALNHDFRMLLVTLPAFKSYQEMTQRLLEIGGRLASSQSNYRGHRPHFDNVPTSSKDVMEWEPTSRTNQLHNNNNQRRAKWVTKDVIENRKKIRACLRCGHKGHMIYDCAFLPAVNPDRPARVQTMDNLDVQAEPMSRQTPNNINEPESKNE